MSDIPEPRRADSAPEAPAREGEGALIGSIPEGAEQVINSVALGNLDIDEAAFQLGVSAEQVERWTQELIVPTPKTRSDHPFADQHERISQNWERAGGEAEGDDAELTGFEALMAAFPPVRWLVGTDTRRMVTAVVSCGFLAGGILYLAKRKDPLPPPVAPVDTSRPGDALPSDEQRERAEQTARAFLAAETWQEKLRFVRKPEETEPAMRDWYESRKKPLMVASPEEFTKIKGTFIEGLPFIIFEAPSDIPGMPIVLAVDVSGNQAKVDWESHVHFQPMSWKDFKTQRPSEPVQFRVRAESSDYYIEPFDDEEKYVSLRLTSPTEVVGLNGFVDRASQAGLELSLLTESSTEKPVNLLLTLRFPEGAQTPAVEIVDLKQGWVSPD